MKGRQIVVSLLLVSLGASVYLAQALAAGGATPATAPTIDPGTRVFANTASDATYKGDYDVDGKTYCPQRTEFWRIDFAAGDKVKFSGQQVAPANNMIFMFFPPGGDPTQQSFRDFAHGTMNEGVVFVANASGAWLLAAGSHCNSTDGPFNFVVTVWHKVLIFLPSVGRVSRYGKLKVHVRTPDGIAITDPGLKMRLYALWRQTSFGRVHSTLLGQASPKQGAAVFAYHLPSSIATGSTIRFQVNASGPIYLPASASTGKVLVH